MSYFKRKRHRHYYLPKVSRKILDAHDIAVDATGVITVTAPKVQLFIQDAFTNAIPVATITVNGIAPVLSQTSWTMVTPVGVINVAGQAPVASIIVNAPVVDIPIAGQVPTVSITTAIAALAYSCHVLSNDTKRTYDFANYNFIGGFGRYNRVFLGAKADGIYDLETDAADDDGTDIDASFEILSDFGLPNYKRFRSLFVEASGDVRITITNVAGKEFIKNISPNDFRSLPRNIRDQAFTIKIENIIGEKITLRRLHGKLDVFEQKGV